MLLRKVYSPLNLLCPGRFSNKKVAECEKKTYKRNCNDAFEQLFFLHATSFATLCAPFLSISTNPCIAASANDPFCTKSKSQKYNPKAKNDLKQRVYQYSLNLIKFIDGLPADFSSKIIAAQLLRSGTSIGANVIEAHGSSSRKDFANFFSHALKSANESKYWLGLLRDAKKISSRDIDPLLQETIELSKILAASLITIRGKRTF